MSHATAPPGRASGWAVGGLIFAATMMLLIGVWQVLMGIAAIAADDFFVVSPEYLYEFNTTAWGWVHLVLGVLVFLVGLALYSGALWARVIGIFFAILVAIANFFFVPYYPLWSLVVIALSVFVAWALAAAPRSAPADLS